VTPARGFGVILLASLLFGVMAVCVRVAAGTMTGPQVAFFRFAGSLLVLLAATRGRGLRPGAGALGPLVLRGLIGATAIVLYFVGIRGTGAGLATLLQNGYPVFASIFAALVLGERVSGRLGAALALQVSGIALVVGPGLGLGSASTLGALAACGSSVLSGAAVVAARHLRRTENAALITTYFMAVGVIVTAPALRGGVPAVTPGVAAALAAVVLTSVAGQWLLHHGLGFVSAARASVITATLLEAGFLGQLPGPRALVGGGLVLAAIALAAERPPGAPPTPAL
jgi:drug/metabolite transporter (DMT)-like permease